MNRHKSGSRHVSVEIRQTAIPLILNYDLLHKRDFRDSFLSTLGKSKGPHAGRITRGTWEIILCLCELHLTETPSVITDICAIMPLSDTTVRRSLNTLAKQDIVRKRADEGDRRRQFIELTGPYLDVLNAYVDQCSNNFQSIIEHFDKRERDIALESLTESRQRFQDYATMSADWFWETDTDHRMREATGKNVSPVKRLKKHILGKTRAELASEYEDIRSKKWRDHYATLEARKPFQNFEYRMTRNNKEAWVSVNGIPLFDAKGEFNGYRGTGIEITERKNAEEKIRQKEQHISLIADSIPALVAQVDRDRRYVYANSKYQEWLGLRSEDMIGRTVKEIVGEESYNMAKPSIDAVLEGKKVSTEVLLKTKDNKTRHVRANFVPDISEDGIVNGYFVLTDDITHFKEMEERNRKARERAEYENKKKTAFLANVSHDLRTPLNAILGFSELMMEHTFGPLGNQRYDEYVQDIRDCGNLVLNMIDDILDLSKIEAGKFILHEEFVNIHKVVNTSVRMLYHQAENKKIRLINACKEELPKIRGDERAITQTINNLLSNAIKFTPQDGEVEVNAWKCRKNGVSIQVTDTGIGMTADDIKKALNPFEQVNTQRYSKDRGTGLVLSLSRRFIEMHNGRLTVESLVGEGTTVTVSIPNERIVSVD